MEGGSESAGQQERGLDGRATSGSEGITLTARLRELSYSVSDQLLRALAIAGSRRCFFQLRPLQRSPSRSRRLGVVRIVYFANSSAGAVEVRRRANASTSLQCSGVETGAPSRART